MPPETSPQENPNRPSLDAAKHTSKPDHLRENNLLDANGVVALRQGDMQKSVPGQFPDVRAPKDGLTKQFGGRPESEDTAKKIREQVASADLNTRLNGMNLRTPAKPMFLGKKILSGDIDAANKFLKTLTPEEFKESVTALQSALQGSGINIDSEIDSEPGEPFSARLAIRPELKRGERGEGVILATDAGKEPKGVAVSLHEDGYRFTSFNLAELDPKPGEVGKNLGNTATDNLVNSVEQLTSDLHNLQQVPLFLPNIGVDANDDGKISRQEVSDYQKNHAGTADAKRMDVVAQNFDAIAAQDITSGGQITMLAMDNYKVHITEEATALAAAAALRGHPEQLQNLPNLLNGALRSGDAAMNFEDKVNRLLEPSGMSMQVGKPQRDDRQNESRQLHFVAPDGRVLPSVTVPTRTTRAATDSRPNAPRPRREDFASGFADDILRAREGGEGFSQSLEENMRRLNIRETTNPDELFPPTWDEHQRRFDAWLETEQGQQSLRDLAIYATGSFMRNKLRKI